MTDDAMRPLYICDLDGTLALIDHRRRYIERPKKEQDWKAFYAACVNDEPNIPVLKVLTSLRLSGAEIWFFSGRSDEVRKQTINWLAEHSVLASWEIDSVLYMRAAGDYTPDDELKKQWLNAMSSCDRRRLVAVFDDRTKVVNMWRDAGVTCFQVAAGDF